MGQIHNVVLDAQSCSCGVLLRAGTLSRRGVDGDETIEKVPDSADWGLAVGAGLDGYTLPGRLKCKVCIKIDGRRDIKTDEQLVAREMMRRA